MRNPERLSDPFHNSNFNRNWGSNPLNIGFGDGLSSKATKRVEAQRAKSHIASLFQSAQQNEADDKAVAVAFREAERLRRQLGTSWAALIAVRAA